MKKVLGAIGGFLGVIAVLVYVVFFTNTLFTVETDPTTPNTKSVSQATPVPAVDVDTQLTLLNNYRVSQGLQPLQTVKELGDSALAHAVDMQKRNYYEHTDPDGVTSYQRISKAVGKDVYAGENEDALCDESTNQGEFDRFIQSPEHKANVVDPRINSVGIGIIENEFSKCNGYLVFDFAQI